MRPMPVLGTLHRPAFPCRRRGSRGGTQRCAASQDQRNLQRGPAAHTPTRGSPGTIGTITSQAVDPQECVTKDVVVQHLRLTTLSIDPSSRTTVRHARTPVIR